MNGAVQVAVNVSSHANDLPSSQTAPCGAVSARTALDLRLQDVRRCDQRRLGRIPITLQLSPCSIKQLGQAVRKEVELLVGSRRRIWCGSLKSFHNHSLDEPIRGFGSARECSKGSARGTAECKPAGRVAPDRRSRRQGRRGLAGNLSVTEENREAVPSPRQLKDHPRRYGCLLRIGRAARQSGSPRQAGRRRRVASAASWPRQATKPASLGYGLRCRR